MGMLASRKGQIGLASAFAAMALPIAWLAIVVIWPAPSTDRARLAYQRRDWREAASIAGRLLEQTPGDLEAVQLRARGLARLGDFRESTRLLAGLGGSRLEAEDLLLIGEGAFLENRPALGQAAVEAATRLDPKNEEAFEAQKRLTSATGRMDRLFAVPGASTLSELIVGLASTGREASTASDHDPILERILSRDRSTFARLESSSSARKLLARALLESGRTVEARDWLGKVELRDDPESHWLLSRAALVEGDLSKARAEADRAGAFGLDDPMVPEPSRYVGAKRCAGCHPEIYRDQQSSHHSATLARGEGLKKVPLPGKDVIDPENPGVLHHFDRSGDDVRITSTVEGRAIVARIDYAMGSGTRGMTMIARGEDGRPRSLRISYFTAGKHWGLTSGFEPRPVDPSSYVGEVLNEESFRNCLNCHATRFATERGQPGPELLDRGIGCERCHGPGDLHVRAIESGFDRPAIARPRLATPAARMKLCAQCHASDGLIPPADPRFIRFHASTLPYSRCVSESGGRLDCVACHDPHRNVETSPAYYEARCLACHGGENQAGGPNQARPGFRVQAVSASRCTVNPTKGCISCHMPKVDEVMSSTSFTDHHIRARRPAEGAGPPTKAVRGVP